MSPQGGGRAAPVLLGQEQTTPEQEGSAPQLALGVPWASCTLLPRRCKSLLLQGRGQGRWKRSCGSIHLTLVLQQRCQLCPTACVPAGLSPAWAHPAAVVGDGEAVQAPFVAGGPFPSSTLRCLQAHFPSPLPRQEDHCGAGESGSTLGPCSQFTAKPPTS